jgi:hypothetical protein
MSSRGPHSHLSPPPAETPLGIPPKHPPADERARGAVADAITSDLVVVTLADKLAAGNLTAESSDGDVALLAFYLVPSRPSAA